MVRQGYKIGFSEEGLPRLSLEISIGSGQAEDGEGRKDDIGWAGRAGGTGRAWRHGKLCGRACREAGFLGVTGLFRVCQERMIG